MIDATNHFEDRVKMYLPALNPQRVKVVWEGVDKFSIC